MKENSLRKLDATIAKCESEIVLMDSQRVVAVNQLDQINDISESLKNNFDNLKNWEVIIIKEQFLREVGLIITGREEEIVFMNLKRIAAVKQLDQIKDFSESLEKNFDTLKNWGLLI